MGISYVIPVWREDVYRRVALPWILKQIKRHGGQLIEVRGEKSIFDSLEKGRKQAKNRFIMYVHDDVALLSQIDLHARVEKAFNSVPGLGLIGPAGKVQKARVPWWLNRGNYVGHWCRRGDRGQLVYQQANNQGGAPFRDVIGDPCTDNRPPTWNRFAEAGLVDGFYLIEDSTRLNQPWDTETYGEQWHGYDVDRCYQAHSMGLKIMVPPWLFLHDNAGHAGYKGTDPAARVSRDHENRLVKSEGDRLWLADLDVVNRLVRQKWGVS